MGPSTYIYIFSGSIDPFCFQCNYLLDFWCVSHFRVRFSCRCL